MVKIRNPLVSIVMACFNANHFLEDAIKSIAEQTYTNWELIVVDDRSRDTSIMKCNTLIQKYNIKDKVKISHHKKNYGYGRTLKDCIFNSSGELIAILDADDALAIKDSIKIMVDANQQHPNASLVYSDHYICDGNLRGWKEFKTRQLNEGEKYLKINKNGTFDFTIKISHFKVFKKSFYDKTIGVNPTLLKTVDKDLILKLEEVGELIHIPQFLYLYRNHSRNLTSSFIRQPKTTRNHILKMKQQIFLDAVQRRGI